MQKRLWCLVLMLVLPLSTIGQDKKQTDSNRLSDAPGLPDCSPIHPPRLPLVVKEKEAELIRELRPTGLINTTNEIEGVCGFRVKPWGHFPNGYIAVLETEVFQRAAHAYEDEYMNVAIALLSIPGDACGFSVVAKTGVPQRLYDQNEFERFDFAPYRLNEKEMAFGVRTRIWEIYSGGGGEKEFLHLYRIKDGVIIPIFSTLMKSVWSIRGKSCGIEQGAQLYRSSHETNGMFDLEKHVGKDKVKPQIFRWDGREYITSDRDPVVDVNKFEMSPLNPCNIFPTSLQDGRGR